MSEPELVAAARRIAAYDGGVVFYAEASGVVYRVKNDDVGILRDAILHPTTPAQRAAVAVLAGDTRPEVLAPILDELAERFAGGPNQ